MEGGLHTASPLQQLKSIRQGSLCLFLHLRPGGRGHQGYPPRCGLRLGTLPPRRPGRSSHPTPTLACRRPRHDTGRGKKEIVVTKDQQVQVRCQFSSNALLMFLRNLVQPIKQRIKTKDPRGKAGLGIGNCRFTSSNRAIFVVDAVSAGIPVDHSGSPQSTALYLLRASCGFQPGDLSAYLLGIEAEWS